MARQLFHIFRCVVCRSWEKEKQPSNERKKTIFYLFRFFNIFSFLSCLHFRKHTGWNNTLGRCSKLCHICCALVTEGADWIIYMRQARNHNHLHIYIHLFFCLVSFVSFSQFWKMFSTHDDNDTRFPPQSLTDMWLTMVRIFVLTWLNLNENYSFCFSCLWYLEQPVMPYFWDMRPISYRV